MAHLKTSSIVDGIKRLSSDIWGSNQVGAGMCLLATARLEQQEKDLQTLYYRLFLEDEKTCSPETLEVLDRLKPIYHPKTD